MRKLRIIWWEKPENAYFNIAGEEALARCFSGKYIKPTLRFFRNKNAVIIGYFQYAEKEVWLDETSIYNVQVVRRFTGGGAVYHDMGNLNYSIVVPFEWGVPRKMIDFYRFFLEPLVNALKKLGVENAGIGKLNDLSIGKRKVGGTAASTRWNIAFFHGTLLIDTNIDMMARILKIAPQKLSDKGVKTLKERVINLKEVVREVKLEEIIDAITKSFAEKLDAEIIWSEVSEIEENTARILYETKYCKKEWNLERKPDSFFEKYVKEIRC